MTGESRIDGRNVLITGAAIRNAGLGTITPHKALIRVDGATTRVTVGGN